jgi:hypothetical protein
LRRIRGLAGRGAPQVMIVRLFCVWRAWYESTYLSILRLAGIPCARCWPARFPWTNAWRPSRKVMSCHDACRRRKIAITAVYVPTMWVFWLLPIIRAALMICLDHERVPMIAEIHLGQRRTVHAGGTRSLRSLIHVLHVENVYRSVILQRPVSCCYQA